MAAGIFGTTRVAGEGIALAITSAVLAALAQTGLGKAVAVGGQPATQAAAQRIAFGDLRGASGLLPEMRHEEFMGVYGDAFQSLLYILTAITVVSAIVVFALLSSAPASGEMPETDGKADETDLPLTSGFRDPAFGLSPQLECEESWLEEIPGRVVKQMMSGADPATGR